MKNSRRPWLLAAVITAGVGVAEAATVLRVIPGATIVATGALLFTGFLAGVFLEFCLAHPLARSAGRGGRSSYSM